MTWLAPLVAALVAVPAVALAATGEPAGPHPTIGTLNNWHRTSLLATIRDGMLYLDALRGDTQVALFRRYEAYTDVHLAVEFKVEPVGTGVRALGLIFGSTDNLTCHYVHIDRRQAILCRSEPGQPWIELARRGGLTKPEGQWYTARVECQGTLIKVFFQGKLLYAVKSPALQPGLVGVYAGQGRAWVRRVEVTGKRARLARPWRLRKMPQSFVYVCQDAGAGGYEAFPDACRLADGRLMAVFYAGYGHVARPNAQLPKGGRVCYCTSADEGRTWSPAAVLYDDDDDNRDPHITQLRDGTLLCTFFTLRWDKDGRRTGTGAQLVRSSDGGKTWEAKPTSVSTKYYCSAPVREMPDGTLLLGLYYEKGGVAYGAVTRSTDKGRTWSTPADIANSGYYCDAETDVIRLTDGSLFAALRTRKAPMCFSRSTDGGKTWTAAAPLPFPGHCPYLMRHSSGVILLAHRIPSTSLHFSTDETKAWSGNVLIDTVGGAYPSLVELKDGTVLCVYYEEGSGSSIRAKRLRVAPTEVKPIPFETP